MSTSDRAACVVAPADSEFDAHIACDLPGARLELFDDADDNYSATDLTTALTECLDFASYQFDSSTYAVGQRPVGDAEGCLDAPEFGWSFGDYEQWGKVRLASGSWSGARTWWLKHHPFGKATGPIWGYEPDPLVPTLSLSALRKLAASPGYKTLLRSAESYQDRLVRVVGKVEIADGSDVYIEVTPVGYGLYKDTIHVDVSNLPTRLVPDDLVEVIGFGNGVVSLVGDIPDITAVRAVLR